MTQPSRLERGANINACRYIGDPDQDDGEGNIGYSAIKHGNIEALKKALDLGLDPTRCATPMTIEVQLLQLLTRH